MAEDFELSLPDRMAETFSGKSIFITGGTGFIGKVLVEKLLRRCPDISNIYMLIRPKKGKNPKQRLLEIFNHDLFQQVRDMYTSDELASKVILIDGDITAEGLNLSQESRDLCTKAEIIIHSAACIRFDAPLKESIILNTRGTKYVLDLAKEFKKLELFVYMSTAYCHPEEAVLEEKGYRPHYNPHEMIRTVEVSDEDTISALTPKILEGLPNCYTLSKALAEALVEETANELPILIMRPSVVVPILYDPLPGWTDNLNGPSGLLIAAGKGVLRSFHGDESNYIDVIPVDVLCNATIVAVWNYIKNGDRRRYINLTSSSEVVVPWSSILDIGKKITSTTVPFNNSLWVPGGSMTKFKWLHNIRAFFFHWLPAILIDILLTCFGYKPILLKVHNRINKGIQVVDYYIKNIWTFRSDTIQELRESLNAREGLLYRMDKELDLEHYMEQCIRCARLYLMKESKESLPAAQRHMTRLKYIRFGLTVLFWYAVANFLGVSLALVLFVLDTIYDRYFIH